MLAVQRTEVPISASNLATNFVAWLKERQIIVYAVVHHTEDMKNRGVDPQIDAWTIIFGNPLLGASFFEETPDVVVDIPLRIGFYSSQDGKAVIVRRSMEDLLSDYDSPALVGKSRKADGLLEQWIASISA